MMVKLGLSKNTNYQRVVQLLLFAGVILFAAGFSTSALAVTFAEQLEQARLNQKQGLYSDAEQIYKAIVQGNPGTESAQEAQANLAIMYVAWDKLPEAKAVYQNLPSDFSGKGDLVESIHEIAYNRLKKKSSLQQSEEIYQFLVKDLAQGEYAMWLQTIAVINHIRVGDEAAAQTALNTLRKNSFGHKDIAQAVNKIGDHYYSLKEYQKACDVFQSVVDSWPQSEYAIRSQLSLIEHYIRCQDNDAAQSACNKLLTVFTQHPDLDWAVKKVGDSYYRWKDYHKARLYYQLAIDTWPQDNIWLYKSLIMTHFQLGEETAAETALKKLFADYADDPDLAEVVSRLGELCRQMEKYEKAHSLYKYVVDNYPQSDCVMESRLGLSLSKDLLTTKNIGGAVDKIITDFAGYNKLPEELNILCIRFYEEAALQAGEGQKEQAHLNFQKGIEVGEKIIEKLPESSVTVLSYKWTADSYRGLGEYDKALQYYQQIVTKWPDNDCAWHAYFFQGRCLEKMKQAKLIEEMEADVRITEAYDKILTQYPNCPASNAARVWLVRRHGKNYTPGLVKN